MTDQSINTAGATPTGLPPLPDGFTLDAQPQTVETPKLPPLPDGFTLDQPIVDQPKAGTKPADATKSGGVIDYAENIAKGAGQRIADLAGGFTDFLGGGAYTKDEIAKDPHLQHLADLGYIHPKEEYSDLSKAARDAGDKFGYKPGTTWEDVRKSPARNFLAFALEQGLVSTPDLAAVMTNLPGYIAAHGGELSRQRAENNQEKDPTVQDMLAAMPAATASALLDRIGGRGMFGLDEIAVQGLKQAPKAILKAGAKEATTEGGQQLIEDVGTNAGTKKGMDPVQEINNVAAATLAGGVTGLAVRTPGALMEGATHKPGAAAQSVPELPEGFTLDQDIQKTNRLPGAGNEGETVETATPPAQSPVTRDGSGEQVSPPDSSLPSASPEQRAMLRRSGMVDEDIDQMSPEEIDQKVGEAQDAGIRINGAMVRAAEQYRAPVAVADQNVPVPAVAADVTPQPSAAISEQPEAATPAISPAQRLMQDYQRRQADVDQAIKRVEPDLQNATQQSVASDQAQEDNIDRNLGAPLKAAVLRSVYEDTNGNGTRKAPVRVQQPEHIDIAAQRVNTEPTDAQKLAGNYEKGHLRVSGLDVTLENPKGSIRRGTSPTGEPWQVEMPAHYGYIKRSTGADSDQVDAYIGDNPQSKRVYVVDQKDLGTRRFDEHKAILGTNSVSEARDLYASAFSDGRGAERIGGITPMSVSDFKRWLASDQTTKPLTMGKPKVRTNEQGFPIDTKGAVKKPDSIIEFLARKGGVQDDHGELSTLGLKDRKTGFVVGAGPLIRRNGMAPDKAREAATEAGYLPEGASLTDFYDALDHDARTNRQWFSQYDDDHAAAWRDIQGNEAQQAEHDNYRSQAVDRLKEDGFPVDEGADFVNRVAAHMANGQIYEDAVEQAYQDIGSAQTELADIPFFEESANEADAGTTPVDRAPSREEGEHDNRSGDASTTQADRETGPVRSESGPEAPRGRSEQDGGRGDQQSPPQRQEPEREKPPVTELGADNKPQLVIPGAERASDAEMAQRGADQALKPKVEQKAPGGLFSDEKDQGDLLDHAKKPEAPKKLQPPERVYHGTSTGGFDSFDTYRGEYGLFGNGGYFTEDPNIALEYTRKGKGETPTVYSAKLNIKNPLDMDAKANVSEWRKAFGDYLEDYDLKERGQTNEEMYRAVEEFLSGEQMPKWEGAEIMQDGLMNMGYDGVTHIGGGRHKASQGTKHRVWIAFDPEQVSDFKEESRLYRPAEDGHDQEEADGVKADLDNVMREMADKEERKRKAKERNAAQAAKGRERDKQLLSEIVNRVAGVDPQFAETLDLDVEGSKLWGETKAQKAAGQYNATDDVITLALDQMNWDVANHEAFHRLQNLFLTDKERAALSSDEPRLRQFLIDSGMKPARVEKMARVEVEAEAFAKWAAKKDRKTYDAKKAGPQPVKINAILRKAWDRLSNMLQRVRNFLNGRGYQTSDDIFAAANEGKIKERQPKETGSLTKTPELYSIAERASAGMPEVDTEPKSPEEAIGTRINNQLKAASKSLAAKVKDHGSKYDRSTAGDNETLAELAHRKIVDYLSPVKRMQEKVGGNLNDLSDAYLTARLAEGTIRHEIHQIDEKYATPAVDELARVGASLEDLHKFMYAMHAPERNRVVGLRNEPGSDLYKAATDPTIRGASGMSTNEAKQTIADLAQDREKFMGIRRAAGHIRAMLDNSLQTQLKNGLINKATYDRLTKQWQNYVPLHAESDNEGIGGTFPSKSRGFDVRGDEFKGATGRFTPADNVVVYAINNAEQSVIRSEKNKAATAALRFINQFDPKGESIAQVYWSEDPEKLGDIEKAPAVYKRVLGSDGKVTQRKTNNFQMRDDVLAAKVGGKTYYMKFADPKVGLALKKMTFSELGVALKVIKQVSNWQSLINTRANPAFIPMNLIRDVQTGASLALSHHFSVADIAKMVGNIPSAWGALWRHSRGKPGNGPWDAKLRDFMASGAKTSFDQYNSVEETLKKLQKDMSRRTSQNKAVTAWHGVIKLIEDLNDTIENGMRLSVFNASRARGDTSKRAAFLARDLTVDFQKKGEITPAMNALYTFFNASVQGNYNFAKGLAKSKKVRAAMVGLMAAGFAQHMWNLTMAGKDDDGENAYLKLLRNEPWKLERNMLFFLPGRKDYITIPLGFGLNAFWHLGVQGGAVTTGDKSFLPAALDSTRVAVDAFNPLGSGGWVEQILPSIIDPIWELGTNADWTGKPIYPSENKFDQAPPPKSQQSFNSTSPVFKSIAETINKFTGGNSKEPGAVDIYPDSLEYLWGWFSGGVGRFVSQTAETAQRAADLEFEPKKTPYIRSFYGSTDDASHKSEYYRERDSVQYAKGKLKEYQDAGDKEDLKDFMDRNRHDINAVSIFDTTEKQRRKINKERRSLEKSDSPDKDAKLKKLDEQEMELMNTARRLYFKAGQKTGE